MNLNKCTAVQNKKRIAIKKVPSIFKPLFPVLLVLLMIGCEKEEATISIPTISSLSLTEITHNTALSGGTITTDGGSTINSKGVCWSKTTPPSISDFKTANGSGSSDFSSNLSDLSPATTYYLSAYAINSEGIAYGQVLTFKTSEAPIYTPELDTKAMLEITDTTAKSGGDILSDGGSEIIVVGVCWSTEDNPSIADDKTTNTTKSGSFSSNISGLLPDTTYYLSAYASNSEGTSYGDVVTFTTNKTIVAPTVTTTAISNITFDTALSGGEIVDDGGSEIIAKGICWSLTANPTVDDAKTISEVTTTSFISTLSPLSENTTYYVSAYATNSKGTSYGETLTFSTSKTIVIPTVTTTAISNITFDTALSGGEIVDNGGSEIIAKGICWSLTANPTVDDSKTTNEVASENFVSTLSPLSTNTTYYVRAYAQNSKGIAYGASLSFTTSNAIYNGDVYIHNQAQMDQFSSLNITTIQGDLVIEPSIPTTLQMNNGWHSLQEVEGSIIISKTKGLGSLSALKNLKSVGGYLIVSFNPGLTSIGLTSLSSIGDYLSIVYNSDLVNLHGLETLSSTNQIPNINITDNSSLINFCGIKPILENYTGVLIIDRNSYNPTKTDILGDACQKP